MIASPARCPASSRFTCLSPAFTTICGTRCLYFSSLKRGSMRFACEPTLSTRQTLEPSENVSTLYPPPNLFLSSAAANVGGKNTPSGPSTGSSSSRITRAAGPSSFSQLSNLVNSLTGLSSNQGGVAQRGITAATHYSATKTLRRRNGYHTTSGDRCDRGGQ